MTAPALAAPTPTAKGSRWLIRSDDQAKMTLQQMRQLVNAALQSHSWVWFARALVANTGAVDSRSPSTIALAIRDYLRQRLHYAPDPVGIENLTPPLEHMAQLQAAEAAGPGGYVVGDCDDAATLSAAIAGAVGIPSTFTIRAFDWGKGPSPFQHVFTTLYPRDGNPVVVDTTRNAQKFPPKVQREFTVQV